MVVFNYYRAIDKSRIQFDFFYDADSTVGPPEDLIEMGARFYKVPPYQYLPQYIAALKRYFKENKYTIVHSHLNTLSVFPLFAAWSCHVPVRIAHSHSVPGGKEFIRNALKYFLRSFATVFPTDYFACSEKAGRWLFGDRRFDDNKVFVLKNAIDFEKFKAVDHAEIRNLRKLYNIDGRIVIGHVGRFTFAKNHEFLLDVFQEISKMKTDFVLMLVGDGELNHSIHESVKKRGLEGRVIFTGKVTNPEAYYHLFDVLVLPSVFEGLPVTAIESQVCGVPLVASTAVPEEAEISDGIRRLNLSDNHWAETVLEMIGKTVVLNERSREYDINYAVKRLEEFYLGKVKQEYV